MKRKHNDVWFAQQTWKNILFIHFPVSADLLKKYVPSPFTLDLYGGKSWISLVAFQALHSRLRGMPKFLSIGPYYQLNVRTYVTFGDKRGVFFFTIYANKRSPIVGGRLFSLPFQEAEILFSPQQKKYILQHEKLTQTKIHLNTMNFQYDPTAKPFFTKKGSLDHWLTERYHLWLIHRNKIICLPISHNRWKLRRASVQTMISKNFPLANDLNEEEAVSHYAPLMESYLYPYEQKGLYVGGKF